MDVEKNYSKSFLQIKNGLSGVFFASISLFSSWYLIQTCHPSAGSHPPLCCHCMPVWQPCGCSPNARSRLLSPGTLKPWASYLAVSLEHLEGCHLSHDSHHDISTSAFSDVAFHPAASRLAQVSAANLELCSPSCSPPPAAPCHCHHWFSKFAVQHLPGVAHSKGFLLAVFLLFPFIFLPSDKSLGENASAQNCFVWVPNPPHSGV